MIRSDRMQTRAFLRSREAPGLWDLSGYGNLVLSYSAFGYCAQLRSTDHTTGSAHPNLLLPMLTSKWMVEDITLHHGVNDV